MNTFQLSCFLAVAETLNFARAAEQLHVTQPAVTQQIHSLESDLNVKLFKRTTRTVKLTEEGKIFIHDAKQIVALSQRAIKRFEDPRDEHLQFLAIGCYSYVHLFLLPDILKKLVELHPGLHPRLQVVPFAHLYRLLEEDDVDAIIGFKGSSSKRIRANYREIAKVSIVCAAPCDHPIAKKKMVTMDDTVASAAIDFSGRPELMWDASFTMDRIGDFPTELVRHFFRSFTAAAGCNLYLSALPDGDSHHTAEALFKAFARAMRRAVRRIPGDARVASTKGVL